jgi:hypothetical protein
MERSRGAAELPFERFVSLLIYQQLDADRYYQ